MVYFIFQILHGEAYLTRRENGSLIKKANEISMLIVRTYANVDVFVLCVLNITSGISSTWFPFIL